MITSATVPIRRGQPPALCWQVWNSFGYAALSQPIQRATHVRFIRSSHRVRHLAWRDPRCEVGLGDDTGDSHLKGAEAGVVKVDALRRLAGHGRFKFSSEFQG